MAETTDEKIRRIELEIAELKAKIAVCDEIIMCIESGIPPVPSRPARVSGFEPIGLKPWWKP